MLTCADAYAFSLTCCETGPESLMSAVLVGLMLAGKACRWLLLLLSCLVG